MFINQWIWLGVNVIHSLIMNIISSKLLIISIMKVCTLSVWSLYIHTCTPSLLFYLLSSHLSSSLPQRNKKEEMTPPSTTSWTQASLLAVPVALSWYPAAASASATPGTSQQEMALTTLPRGQGKVCLPRGTAGGRGKWQPTYWPPLPNHLLMEVGCAVLYSIVLHCVINTIPVSA